MYYILEAREPGGDWTLWAECPSHLHASAERDVAKQLYPSYTFRIKMAFTHAS